MDPIEVSFNAECFLAHRGPFLLSMWRGPLTQESIATHFLAAGELRRKYVRFGMVLIVEPCVPPPQLDGRRLLGDLYGQLSPNLIGLAQVIRGQGFILSAARALMSAVLAPYAFPSRIFAESEGAVPWLTNLVTQRHHSATREQLQGLIASAYAQYSWRLPSSGTSRLAV